MIRKILRVLMPIGALAVGIAITVALVRTKPKAKKAPRDERGAMVEVVEVARETKRVHVEAHGTVIPARSVVVAPEVNGKVVWVANELVPGGRFEAGDPMLRLDGRDYQLALEAQLAQIEQAEAQLAMKQRQKQIVEREWELMGKEGDPLTLQKKQLAAARKAVEAARSTSSRARLNVGRTLLKAPFNAVVQARNVDVGQIIGPASPAITLAGTDEFWVQISVPVERLVWLDIPGVNVQDREGGSQATVWRELNGQRVERSGQVIRLLGDVDPMGRMARLLVSIEDPLGVAQGETAVGEEAATAPPLPLLLGSFVQVDLHGRAVDRIVELPREALREGDKVYVMAPEQVEVTDAFRGMLFWAEPGEVAEMTQIHRLDIRPVEVVWRKLESVYLRKGIEPGDKVVVSPVAAPIDGMKLRPAGEAANGRTAKAPGPDGDGVRQQ